jgi:alpha-galactosidase
VRFARSLRLLTSAATAVAACAIGILAATPAQALDNGLALTPPMGFNDWNSFGCNIDAQDFRDVADYIVAHGLKDAGYEYVNIDDCWMAGRDIPRTNAAARAAAGRDPSTLQLIPDPAYFPDVDLNGNGVIDPSEQHDGIKALADYIHSKGLKIGIYESAGTTTCQGLAGSLGYESIDAQTFADWSIDYLKLDNCGSHSVATLDGRSYSYPDTVAGYQARYAVMRDALAATGRPIVYSICDFSTAGQSWTWGAGVGNLWRTTGDISASYSSVVNIFKQNVLLAQYAGPGHWNDPDMLEVGNGTGLSPTENRTHFSLWAMMSAPLIIGANLTAISDDALSVLENADVIAVDQDSLGAQASVVSHVGTSWVLAKPLANGDVAVALFNEGDSAATISTTVGDVGVTTKRNAYSLTDLWSKQTTSTAGKVAATVPAHGTVVYRVSAAPGAGSAAPSVTLSAGSNDTALAVGGSTDVTVTLANNSKVAISAVSLGLTAPDGWNVTQLSPPARATLPKGATATATYRVTAPSSASVPIDPAQLTATGSYYSDATGTVSTTTPLTISVYSPVQAPLLAANTTGASALYGQAGSALGISATGANVGPSTGGPGGTTAAGDAYGAIYLPASLGTSGSVHAVVTAQSGGSSAKAGVFARNDADAGGTPVGVAVYVSNGRVAMVYNNTATGGSAYTTRVGGGGFGAGTLTLPVLVRLTRSGSSYTGDYSTDGGATWTVVGTVIANGQADLQDAGVFQSSGSSSPALATFSDLAVS